MQTVYQYRSESLEDTNRLAAELAALFVPGTVIALDGDLGAGKTAFSQAAARALGVEGVVNSPTFTIIKEYEGRQLPFYHMDVYRLSMEEADELGLDEFFFGDGVTIVEWASLIEDILPEARLEIKIEHKNEASRLFHIVPYGEPYGQWCRTLKEKKTLL